MSKSRIVPIKQAEVTSIESAITIVDVQKAQLKVIENSDAWEEHKKTHAGAQLHVLGIGDKKGLGEMEKALLETDKKKQKSDEDSLVPHKKDEKTPDVSVSYKSGGPEGAKSAYHSHNSSGAMLASCTCGQTFKADDKGVSPYKLTTEVTKEDAYSSKPEGHGYKKKEDEIGGSYKSKSVHDEIKGQYGR